MQPFTIVAKANWDEEAQVWVATSEDLPGLVTEAEDLKVLLEKVILVAQDLLEDDGDRFAGLAEIPIVLMSQQIAKVRLGT